MELSNFMGVPVHHGRSTKDSHTLRYMMSAAAHAVAAAGNARVQPLHACHLHCCAAPSLMTRRLQTQVLALQWASQGNSDEAVRSE
jgi:hypothetical protein